MRLRKGGEKEFGKRELDDLCDCGIKSFGSSVFCKICYTQVVKSNQDISSNQLIKLLSEEDKKRMKNEPWREQNV